MFSQNFISSSIFQIFILVVKLLDFKINPTGIGIIHSCSEGFMNKSSSPPYDYEYDEGRSAKLTMMLRKFENIFVIRKKFTFLGKNFCDIHQVACRVRLMMLKIFQSD